MFDILSSQDEYEDPHKPSPSPVVHVRGLTDNVSEGELVESIQNFGPISYVFMLTRRRQALVEFEVSEAHLFSPDLVCVYMYTTLKLETSSVQLADPNDTMYFIFVNFVVSFQDISGAMALVDYAQVQDNSLALSDLSLLFYLSPRI